MVKILIIYENTGQMEIGLLIDILIPAQENPNVSYQILEIPGYITKKIPE